MPIESINPANGNRIREYEPLDAEMLGRKITQASQAFRRYGEVPQEYRALWMRRLAAIMEAEIEELAGLITSEMGKPLAASRQEIGKCVSCCRFYADHAARFLAEDLIDTEAAESYVRWEPLGVILAVMPWNFPFWQVFRFLAPALMAGNVGLLKHSPNVPQCALAIEELVRRAGFPRGTLQTLLIDVEQVASVIADDRVVAVTLTGSETAGKTVAAHAAWLIKRSVLELGGSDPFIVMPSADLPEAVAAAATSRCINSGQSCIAAKRFIVHEAIYDQFEVRFIDAMEAMRVGDPMLETTDIGPLATGAVVEKLERQVQAALAGGARLLTGGERMMGEGNYFEPTILAGLPRSVPVYREEIFGPVALLFRAGSLDEAIEIANDTPFGLGASAWTKNSVEKQRFILDLQCGQVFLNAMVASDPRLPFGGIKRSGYGRELSAAGMREFMNAKTVVVAEISQAMQAPVATHRSEAAEVNVVDDPSIQDQFTQDQFSRALDDALTQDHPELVAGD